MLVPRYLITLKRLLVDDTWPNFKRYMTFFLGNLFSVLANCIQSLCYLYNLSELYYCLLHILHINGLQSLSSAYFYSVYPFTNICSLYISCFCSYQYLLHVDGISFYTFLNTLKVCHEKFNPFFCLLYNDLNWIQHACVSYQSWNCKCDFFKGWDYALHIRIIVATSISFFVLKDLTMMFFLNVILQVTIHHMRNGKIEPPLLNDCNLA